MPAYSSMRVADLRKLCDERGISHDGCTKADVIAALRQHDFEVIDNVRASSDDDSASGDDEADHGQPEAETSEIQALKLRLQLAREERKTQESKESAA